MEAVCVCPGLHVGPHNSLIPCSYRLAELIKGAEESQRQLSLGKLLSLTLTYKVTGYQLKVTSSPQLLELSETEPPTKMHTWAGPIPPLLPLRPDKAALFGLLWKEYHSQSTALGRVYVPVTGVPTWKLSCTSVTYVSGPFISHRPKEVKQEGRPK